MIGNIAYYDYPVDYGKNEEGKKRRYPTEASKEQDKKTKRHFDIILTDDEGKPYLRQVLDKRGKPIRVPIMEHAVGDNGEWLIDFEHVPKGVDPSELNKLNWLYKQSLDEKGNPLFDNLTVPDEKYAAKSFPFGPEFVKYIRSLNDLAKSKGESFKWNPVVFSKTGFRDDADSDEEEKLYYDSDDLKRIRNLKNFINEAGPIFTDEGLDKKSAAMWEKALNVGDDFEMPLDPNKAALSKAKEKIWDDARFRAQQKRDKINDELNKRDFLSNEEREAYKKERLSEIDREMFDNIEKDLKQLKSPNIKKKYPEELQQKEKPDKWDEEADKQRKEFREMFNTVKDIIEKDSSISTKEKNAKLKELGSVLTEKEFDIFEDLLNKKANDENDSKSDTVYDPFKLFTSKLPKNNRKSQILSNILNESMDFSPLLGDPLDERPMPYIFADLGSKKDTSDLNLNPKYRKKLYGWKYKDYPNVQWDIFRDNENSPFYNLNHPMWNMSDEEYAKWADDNPDLATISPQYANYTGKLVRNAAGKPKAMDYDARDKRRMRKQGVFKDVPILSKSEALDYLTGDFGDKVSGENADKIYDAAKEKWGKLLENNNYKNNWTYGMLARATDANGVVHPELLPRFTSMALLQNYPKTFDENGRLVIDLDKNIRDRNADGIIRKARTFDPEKREKQLRDRYINALLEDALKTWNLTPEQRKASFDPKTMEILARLDDEEAAKIGEDKRTHHYVDPQWRIASKGEINSKRKSDINTLFNNNRNQNAENIEFLEKHGIPIDQDARTFARQIMDYDTYKDIFLDPKNISLKDRLRAMLEIIANSDKWNDYKPSGVSNSVMNTLTNLHDGGRL